MNEEILKECFQLQAPCWTLHQIPTVGFYRELFYFLRKWPLSHLATKTAIGKFFVQIDPELQKKSESCRPDNVYRFIEKIVKSDRLHSVPMNYSLHGTIRHLQTEVKQSSAHLQDLKTLVTKQEIELFKLRKEVELAREELENTNHSLEDVTNKLHGVQRQRDRAFNKVDKCQEKLEATAADFVYHEEELLAKNDELSELVSSLEKEITSLTGSNVSLHSNAECVTFCFQTKVGKVYSPAIRELYYNLLSNQMPPAKIATTIKTVLKNFLPSVDLEHLELPGRSCASYMRNQELTTVNQAHKAMTLLENSELGPLHLNTDGTTKMQKKLQGVALNGMVLSVNEVPDGSARSIIQDMSQELQKLREVARALDLPNADKINFTLIGSSTSDSASTQKKFNKLLQEEREKDDKKFGVACQDAIELIENFCCMH